MFYIYEFSLIFILTCAKRCSCQVETGQKQSGAYDVEITSIAPCEKRNDTEQMGFFNTRMSKYNRTHSCLGGLYSFPYGLTDDMQESWEIFLKGSTGGWKRLLTFKNKKACSDKKRIFPQWFDLMKLGNTSCPIPRGNYSFDCFNLIGFQFGKIKVMTYGQYRAKIDFYYKKGNIGCTEFRAELTPSKKSQ